MLIDGQYCQPGRSSFFLGEFHGTLERSRELSLQVFHIFLLLCTFVRVDSSLDVLLSIMAIVELLHGLATVTGFMRPKPPSLAGSANNTQTSSPGGGCPVSAWMKRDWIAFSRDSRVWSC